MSASIDGSGFTDPTSRRVLAKVGLYSSGCRASAEGPVDQYKSSHKIAIKTHFQ